jgi:diguanylate cyclase (GGDEF)-like protein
MVNRTQGLPLTDTGLVLLLEHMPDALLLCDPAGAILGRNAAANALFSKVDPAPEHLVQLVPEIEEWGPAGLETMADTGELDATFPYPAEPDRGAPVLRLWIRASTTRNADDAPRVLLSLRDLSKEYEIQERLRGLSMTDDLTGIPNRRFMKSTLEFEEERARRFDRLLFLMFLDLDGFKMINDLYGHGVGDRAIAHFATVLKQNVRRIDTVCRWGGDEFVVLGLCTHTDGALTLLHRILAAAADQPLEIGDEVIPLRASVGMVIARYTRETPLRGEQLLDEADNLMLQVKGREGIQYLVGEVDDGLKDAAG